MRKSYAKFSYGVRKIRIQCEKFAYSAKKYFSCARRWLSHKTSSWSDTWSFVLSVRAPVFGIFERKVLFFGFLSKVVSLQIGDTVCLRVMLNAYTDWLICLALEEKNCGTYKGITLSGGDTV